MYFKFNASVNFTCQTNIVSRINHYTFLQVTSMGNWMTFS